MNLLNVLRSRTLMFSAVLAFLSAMQGLILQLPLSPTEQAIVGGIVAAIVAVLRVLTTQPINQR